MAYLRDGQLIDPPTVAEAKAVLLAHLQHHYDFYGEFMGVRTARKHIGWYVTSLQGGEAFRQRMNALDETTMQLQAVADFFDELAERYEYLPYCASADLI